MRKAGLHIILSAVIALTATTGCGRNKAAADADVIWDAGAWSVTASNIYFGNEAIGAGADTTASRTLRYMSAQPSIDMMFNLGADAALSLSESWTYPVDDITSSAGVMALADAEKAMELLRTAADGCRTTDRYWPLAPSHAEWVAAAWEVYLATADDDWLRELYATGRMILERDYEVAFNPEVGLFAGLADRSDTGPDTYRLDVNVVHAYGFATLANAARALGDDRRATRYDEIARELATAINDRLWIPELGRYGSCLKGSFFPLTVTDCDNRGQALAIIHGIATPEMAVSIINSTPLPADGVPDSYPSDVHPTFSPATQTLWGIAARKVKNERAMLFALASSMRIMTSKGDWNSEPERCGVAMSSVMKILFGIQLSEKGLSLRPVIPTALGGSHRLSSLEYRNMTLDITVNGTGDRPARFELDGQPCRDNIVADTLSGHHTVTVTMANNEFAPSEIAFIADAVMPEKPVVATTEGALSCRIVGSNDRLRYTLGINGVVTQDIKDGRFQLERPLCLTAAAVMAVDDNGFSSAPSDELLLIAPGDSMMVFHNDIPHELRKSVEASRRRKRRRHVRPQPDHLEMTRSLNTSLTIHVNAPDSGSYFIGIEYWRPIVNESLLTDLQVNGHHAGTFVMYASFGLTNNLVAHLHKGRNTITLTHRRLPADTDDGGACLRYIRFIRKPK